VLHYIGRLKLSGRTHGEVKTILADIAKQPVPARLIISLEEYATEKMVPPRLNGTLLDGSETLGSIGVGLRTLDGR
jgi:hypothetical protein